jgi:DNA replication factor GINS
MNIHRSYHLFTGKPQFNFLDSTPLNLTSEEEKFYFSIIDTLKIHRERISADVINEIESNSFNQGNNLVNDDEKINDNIKINNNVKSRPKNFKSSNLEDIKLNKEKNLQDNNLKDNLKEDKVLNRIEDIKKSKIIKNEKKENITKQIANSKTNSKNPNLNSDNNNSDDINSDDVNNNNFNSDTNSKNNHINNEKPLNKKTSKNFLPENKHSNLSTKNIPSNDKNSKKTSKNPNNQFIDLENEEEIYLNKSKRKLKINDKIINETILLFEDMPSIMGVDTKVYGPFRGQDVAVLPVLNADIIVKNKKGRYLKI